MRTRLKFTSCYRILFPFLKKWVESQQSRSKTQHYLLQVADFLSGHPSLWMQFFRSITYFPVKKALSEFQATGLPFVPAGAKPSGFANTFHPAFSYSIVPCPLEFSHEPSKRCQMEPLGLHLQHRFYKETFPKSLPYCPTPKPAFVSFAFNYFPHSFYDLHDP